MSFSVTSLSRKPNDVIAHVLTGQVEHQLVALLSARAAGEVQHPVGMLAVEIAESGLTISGSTQRPKSMPSEWTLSISGLSPCGNFCWIDVPVAQAGVIVFALAEPAVVHHKAVNAERRGLLRERHLAGFIHAKFGGFPRVVEHRPRFRRLLLARPVRQHVIDLEAMQQARSAAQAMVRIASIEDRRFERLARVEARSRNRTD